MMKRVHYRIIVKFTFSNGQPGGVLDTTVNSKVAVERQVEINRRWLNIKGHTIDSVKIEPV